MNLDLSTTPATFGFSPVLLLIAGVLFLIGFIAMIVATGKKSKDGETNSLNRRGKVAAVVMAVGILGALSFGISASIEGSVQRNNALQAVSHTNDTKLMQAAKTTYGINLPRDGAFSLLQQGQVDGSSMNRQQLGTGSYLQDGAVHSVTLYHLGKQWVLVDAGTKIELDRAL